MEILMKTQWKSNRTLIKWNGIHGQIGPKILNVKCREIQRNLEQCRVMQRNAEECREM